MEHPTKRKYDDDSRTSDNISDCPESRKISKPNNAKTRLQDLNEDCLIMIFKNLSEFDLVNIVEYDDHFQSAALEVFRKNFARRRVEISNERDTVNLFVKLIKYFGNQIHELVVHYSEDYHRFDKLIDDAICLYCGETLREIVFMGTDRCALIDITEPFKNVSTVSFIGGRPCDLISEFDKWFPMAHTLKLILLNYGKHIIKLNRQCPALQNIEYAKYFDNQNHQNSDTLINSIMNMNPQLRTLRIELHLTNKHALAIYLVDLRTILAGSRLTNLWNLHFVFEYEGYIIAPPFHFESLKNLTISLTNSMMLKHLPWKTDSLDSFKLNVCLLEQGSVEFITNNRNVKMLELNGEWTSDAVFSEVLNQLQLLPQLVELSISYRHLGFRQHEAVLQNDEMILSLLKFCRTINKLTVCIPTPVDASRLSNLIHVRCSQWETTTKLLTIECIRK